MKKFTTRFLTVLLSVAILISVLPMSVFAAEIERGDDEIAYTLQEPTSGQADESEKVYAVDEDVTLRNENTKYIRMSDGSYYVALYDTAVHYLNEDDEWVEIDNTLSQSEASDEEDFAGVGTNKGMVNVKFANNSNSSKLVAIKDGNYKITFGMVGANKTKAVTVKNPEAHAEDATKLERLIHVKKAVSSVVYEDILENIDLEYVVTGNDIKENIIIKAKSDSYVYEFDMKLNKLTAELLDDGTIALKDEKSDEIVFTIGLPFLMDANGEYSNAVTYSLEQIKNKEYRITVTADNEWMNTENRVFPVVIDPPISVGEDDSQVSDAYIADVEPTSNNGTYTYLLAGYATSETYRVFWKLNQLPSIPNNSIITSAILNLSLDNYAGPSSYTDGIVLGAYNVIGAWTESGITWNNQPSSSSTAVDYQIANTDKVDTTLAWDITYNTRRWYQGYTNQGVSIRAMSESMEGTNDFACMSFGSSEHASIYPVFTMTYRSAIGLEDYYTYQTQSIGRAGTGYINDFTSQLTIVHPDVVSGSETLPFTISHVYNSSYTGQIFTENSSGAGIYTVDFSNMIVGYGWKLNVQETLVPKTIGSTLYYIYNDSDGTEHYIYYNSTINKWMDEDGLGLTMTSVDGQLCLTDKQGTQKIFINNILNSIVDANGNKIQLNYDSDNRLNSITRCNNSVELSEIIATFSYDSLNRLSSIYDATGRETKCIYNGYQLTEILAPDDFSALYSYSNNKLVSAYDNEALYGIDYVSNISASYKTNAITRVTEYYIGEDGKNIGKTFSIEANKGTNVEYTDYGNDATLGTSDDVITTYCFDNEGRTVSVFSTDNTKMKTYGASSSSYVNGENADANHLSSFGVTGYLPENFIRNSSAEFSASWNISSNVSRATDPVRTGYYSYALAGADSSETYISQTLFLDDADVYTASAYVDVSGLSSIASNGGVYIKVISDDGSIYEGDKLNVNLVSGLDDQWQRIYCTFYPELGIGGTYTIYICLKGATGTVYVDDIQVESSSAPSSYNLLGNLSEWNKSTNCTVSTYSDGVITKDALYFVGDPYRNEYATQYAYINKSAKTTFHLSAYAVARSAPARAENDLSFSISLTVCYTDGTEELIEFPFTAEIRGETQFVSGVVVPTQPEKTIELVFLNVAYFKNINDAYVFDICLVEDDAQSYTYDGNGNLTAINQTDSSSIASAYDDTNRLLSQSQSNQNYVYTYKSTGNTRLVDTVSSDGVTMKFTYDSAGNVTGTVITDAPESMTISSSTSYTSDKNFVSSVTDSTGATTYYGYNNRGLLTSSLNAKNTLVEYDYDGDTDRQINSYISGVVSAAYEYANGALSKITRGGYIEGNSTKQNQEYNFVYDGFGNVTKIKIGDSLLVTYEYGDNNGHLTKTIYGNGTVIENVYDVLDRIIQIKYNGVVRYNYSYNGNGDLYRVEDVLNDITYNYEYDSLDRLYSSYTTIGTSIANISRYTYDEQNRVSVYHCGIGGVTGGTMNHTYAYTYDEADEISGDTEASNLLKGMTVSGTGISDTLTFTYDSLQRVTAKTTVGAHITLAQSYGYKAVSGNRTTTQIENYTWTSNGSSAVAYSYTYDAVGNILTVSENNTLKASYTYDEQNQLLTETLWDTGIRYEYTYDTYGNIRSVEEYNANTGALISSDLYSYTNSTWLDRLTAFNGTTITYDAIGNPLSYNNGSAYTFTWDGRELASVVKGGVTTSYTYGADGLRTKKQYGTTTYNYYYVDGRLVRMTWINSYIDFLYDESGSVYSIIYDGTQYYFVKNLQGDVVQIRSVWGTLLVEYDYDAWGNCTVVYEHSSYGDLAEINPIRYRGYFYDFETGFYYLQSRYYDPQIRRFISADSYVNANGDFIGFNMYSYCLNNPIIYADYSGESVILVIGGIAITTKALTALFATVSVGIMGVYAISQTQNTLPQIQSSSITVPWIGLAGIAFGSSHQKIVKREDAKIKNIVKHSSKVRYWTATLHADYVSLGRELTYAEALQEINSGHNVFTVTSREAMALALAASKKSYIGDWEVDSGKENTIGYYKHYHTNPKNGGHVFFLLP